MSDQETYYDAVLLYSDDGQEILRWYVGDHVDARLMSTDRRDEGIMNGSWMGTTYFRAHPSRPKYCVSIVRRAP